MPFDVDAVMMRGMSSTPVIQDRICRATRARVIVIDASKDDHFDASDGRWITWCDTHETFSHHDTRTLAIHHAGDSSSWCGLCSEDLD